MGNGSLTVISAALDILQCHANALQSSFFNNQVFLLMSYHSPINFIFFAVKKNNIQMSEKGK